MYPGREIVKIKMNVFNKSKPRPWQAQARCPDGLNMASFALFQ
jgi:hypothetical protein